MLEWIECDECEFLFFPDIPRQRLCLTCGCAQSATDGLREADVITILEGIKE